MAIFGQIEEKFLRYLVGNTALPKKCPQVLKPSFWWVNIFDPQPFEPRNKTLLLSIILIGL